ncbi:MAG: ATP-binding protein [Paracoccaceae bacterium]|nr:ATP-binding protein [Paracoccaceae bacterium]
MTATSTQAPRDMTGLLADMFEALSEGIAIYDENACLVTCNRRYKDMFAPVADLIEPGVSWRLINLESVRRGVYTGREGTETEIIDRAEEDLAALVQGKVIDHADGRSYEVSYNSTSSGGFVITRTDVTERRQTEVQLRERDALLTTILDTNPTPVVMARLSDSNIVYRSAAAREMYGEGDYALSYYSDPEARARYVADLKRDGRVRDRIIKSQTPDGREFMASLSGGLTEYNGETCVVSSVTDVTEDLERDALIRLVVEACPAPILMIRAETGEILFRSPQATELYGAKDNAREFYVKPGDRNGFLGELRRHREVTEYREKFLNAKGEPFWCAVSARLIQWGGEDVIVSHSRDLTGQLAIEEQLARQREQVFQSEKMSALGSLLAGVAHELNNPLSVVVGHAMMLSDETDDPAVLRQTKKISDAAERCSKIVRTFLTMARQEPVRMEPVDIAELVETAVEVARYGNPGRTVRIETDLEEGLPPICADIDQITQAVVNLIINAEQAIEDASVGDRICVFARKDTSKDVIRIDVEDNGPGVPAEIRARVFEPFFTTKGVGKGTGIGLAVCHRVVTAHKGRIEVSDAQPTGTRFTITLPVGDADMKCRHEATEALEKQDTVRVLVIDDEADVADLNVEVLERAGYKAEAVYEAANAFDMLRAQRYDVVLSDLNMPDVDGRGVFETIAADFPELVSRTGFVTGDTMGRASQIFLKESRRPYLEKPVSPKELRAFVAQLNTEGQSE